MVAFVGSDITRKNLDDFQCLLVNLCEISTQIREFQRVSAILCEI